MARIRLSRYAQVAQDRNEPELVAAAQRLGLAWWQGPPLDGWILSRGLWLAPVEIKVPERKGHKHEYTPSQLNFIRWCKEQRAPFFTWRTVDDVMKTAGARLGA